MGRALGCAILLVCVLILVWLYVYAWSAKADDLGARARHIHRAGPAVSVVPVVYEPYVPFHRSRVPAQPPQPSPRTLSIRAASGGTSITGKASWYASWCNCNAMTDQRWRGEIVTVRGPIGTRQIRINDAGPVPRLHRVADLNPTVFKAVCGPLSKGICTVTITGP